MNFPLASTDHKPAFGLGSEKSLHAPLGAASPLWIAFASVAGAGVAYWWMTRWMRPLNIEALVTASALAVEPPIVVDAPVEAEAFIAEAVAIEAEPPVEVFEPVVEAASVESEAPVTEAAPVLVEPEALPAPAVVKVTAEPVEPAPKVAAAAKKSAPSAPKAAAKPRKARAKTSSARPN